MFVFPLMKLFLFLEIWIFVLFTPYTLWVLHQKLYFFPRCLCFNYLQEISYPKLSLLGPVPFFPLQEQIPSISFSFNLIFNLSFIMDFFTKTDTNWPRFKMNMCARVPIPLYVYTHMQAHTFMHSQAKTHTHTSILEFNGSWSVNLPLYSLNLSFFF